MEVKVLHTAATDSERMKADLIRSTKQTGTNMAKGKSPLSRAMDDHQANWLIQHVADRWGALHSDLSVWRGKMKKWEEMSEGDYSYRKGIPNPNNRESVTDVFSYQNETLGMTEGFVDFAAAQAKDDLFGTRPWLTATPEGSDDTDLAELITKHAQWKFNQSNLEATLQDGIDIACWGGTAFVKSRYVNKTEEYVRTIQAAHSITTGAPIMGISGDFVTTIEDLPEGTDGADVMWQEVDSKEVITVKKNVSASCLDYNDIAFDSKAVELDLEYTDVFCRVRMGLLDVVNLYNIEPDQAKHLRALLVGPDEEARTRRGESNTTDKSPYAVEDDANPMISLVEGYVSCDPLRTGRAVRIQCVFSPELLVMFSCDYLANITPDAILPIFPIRIHKINRRIFGRGYFEKYESPNNSVDRQHNAVTYRDQLGSNVFVGIDRTALLKPDGQVNVMVDSRTPIDLAPEKKLADLLSFMAMPDNNSRAIELMNQAMQMAQMRSGITSAAQGELKGVPSASTATGVNQLQSRGALLLKDNIDQLSADVRPCVEFNVLLVYANQDSDETFAWGDGKDNVLMHIKADDVVGIRAHVTLTMVQAQNQAKLASAQAAIGIAMQYVQLPETDKVSQRRLYVQAIASLGFHDADAIVRQAAVDAQGILALVPQDQQPAMQAAMVQAGMIAPPPPTEAAGAPSGASGPPPANISAAPSTAPVTPGPQI